MKRNTLENVCWVVPTDGMLQVYDKNGDLLGGEIFVRVHDEVSCIPKAIVKLHVNIAGSVDEMRERINQLKSTK